MRPRIEVVAIDALMVRLFDVIAEANMPWMLAATQRLRDAFGAALVDLVPSYTTLMVHYDLCALSPAQARERIDQALTDLQPQAQGSGQRHVLPVWYDLCVGRQRSDPPPQRPRIPGVRPRLRPRLCLYGAGG
jgi:allophanate hydrolase subunit 1